MSQRRAQLSERQTTLPILTVAPGQVARGINVLRSATAAIAALGRRPLVVASDRVFALIQPALAAEFPELERYVESYQPDCSEATLTRLQKAVRQSKADVIIGAGGGKALDTAKLLAYQCKLPVVTIPTTGATCAAWTALSNVYSDDGAFLYDVPLARSPDLLILDYQLVLQAPKRTLVAGIGDAIAKWYEASVSSASSDATLIIGAVQQARVLRDLLLQKSAIAVETPGSEVWQEVVDATVLLTGVIGGLGGAQCRTVAAHAVHNGLTQLLSSHNALHGEKVAYGILVQLRLEELIQGSQLAATARKQLVSFYSQLGLPLQLADLGMGNITLTELQQAAEFACQPESDIHHLPFPVEPAQLMAAMVSTLANLTAEEVVTV
ncbi:MAG: iron-containing alcohol dehydrogenase family protein [Cyanobacteria bacterium P01_H01_bin.121]